MRSIIRGVLFAALLCAVGCEVSGRQKEIVARVNTYELTKEQFDEEFKNSTYGRIDTPESRRECLNMLINRKLILQEAARKGLDKEKSFLKSIERFWEQSLLKVTMDKKAREISASITEDDIKAYYDKAVSEGKTTQSYEAARAQMRKEVLSLKNWLEMNAWIESLRTQARISIDKDLLERK